MRKILTVSILVLLSFTVTACKSEEVKNVESAISTLGEIDLEKKEAIVEVEQLFEALPEEEKTKVENYELLENAWVEYDDILKDFSDETKFCASALATLYDDVKDMEDKNIENIGMVNVDDVNYTIVILTPKGEKNNNEAANLYILTNEDILVLSKSLGEYDSETGFTVFTDTQYVDEAFKNNYDLENNVDKEEVVLLTTRYFETGDKDFINIGKLAKIKSKNPGMTDRERLDRVTLLFTEVGNLQLQFQTELDRFNFDALDEIYRESAKKCEEIRRTDLSGYTQDLEDLKTKTNTSLTLMSYSNIMVSDSFLALDKDTMNMHSKNVVKYSQEFVSDCTQFIKDYEFYTTKQ